MGGLGGHMSHVYENMHMSFNDLIGLFSDMSSGKIEATEKVDGQNLYFTYDLNSNQVRFARNSGHAKMGGIPRSDMTAEFVKKGGGRSDYALSLIHI